MEDDEKWMLEALRIAECAGREGEVPVGAVIVKGDRVLGRAGNQVEQLHDATAHAEMIALTQASEALGNWRLEGASLYVTLEPCPMCAGAMVLARVARLVIGADDPIWGACGSTFNIVGEKKLNHRIPVVRGVLAERCGELIKGFFKARRKAQS